MKSIPPAALRSGGILDGIMSKLLGMPGSVTQYSFSISELIGYILDDQFYIAKHLDQLTSLNGPPHEHQIRWNDYDMSSFITSIIIGVPLQPIYLRRLNCEGKNSWAIIDGYNRLYALYRYIVKEDLSLKSNNVFSQYIVNIEGTLYKHLMPEMLDNLVTATMPAYIFDSLTRPQLLYDLMGILNFDHIESYNDMEMRRYLRTGIKDDCFDFNEHIKFSERRY